ncbi:alkene reductase [Bacillus sp. FJAT-27264]|uniref:alkene reductase n=1 Tax=Paenibacillus sp. (strain DSM 101736 / FJAT-27264) TaxID=1850362 RepID=UPI000807DF8E|nr:alkene reductase [Bacillus sp. FJAT-27264]OBZ18848.1 alkene reductase [Bacillus sp. FJAT-27264]
MSTIWKPVVVGDINLQHRLALAPMTRSRAQFDGTPGTHSAEYYAQRASMGLLISEGAQPSEDGQGYLFSPGVYTEEHIAGWKQVADRVHEAGGHLFIQLMHAGRMSHPDNTPHHRQPVAPSAIAPNTQMYTATGLQDIPVPRELSLEEIQETISDFRRAAAAAIQAGADGVEIHGANGYLVHQFISENANVRTDSYGGSIENRARFALEVATAVAEEIGASRTGIRLSPGVPIGDLIEGTDGPKVYEYLVSKLAELNLAYLHILHGGDEERLKEIRSAWPTVLIVNRPGRPLEELDRDLKDNLADIVSVGTWALANPDLVDRLKSGAPLNAADPTTFYGGDSHGYTDYPTLK